MFPEVVAIVLGRAVSPKDFSRAVLRDHRRAAIPDRPYPTGFASLGDSIEGVLVENLSATDIQRFDAYEESFYRRVTVTVDGALGTTTAFTYIDSRDPLPFPLREWNPETFRKDFLPKFVQHLRSRL